MMPALDPQSILPQYFPLKVRDGCPVGRLPHKRGVLCVLLQRGCAMSSARTICSTSRTTRPGLQHRSSVRPTWSGTSPS